MRQVTIYGLYDVRQPGLICYVGLTLNPRRRLTQHWKRDADGTRRGNWVAKLKAEGYPPALVELESVPWSEKGAAECRWIKRCMKSNPSLLNIAPGGGGPPLADTRDFRSRIMKEVWSRPDYKRKMKMAMNVTHVVTTFRGRPKLIGPRNKFDCFYSPSYYYKGWRKQKRDPRWYLCQNPACGIEYQRQVGRRGDCGTKFCSRKCSDSVSSVQRGQARITIVRK